jgi:hypothetical protein
VVEDYEGPFAFTGRIERVTFEIRGQRDARDAASAARTERGRD